MALTKLNRYSLPTTLDLSAKTLTLPSASVTAHVTATDLQPLKSDLSALALREATNESSAAFNLPNQFIDTFATDTIGTKTNVSVSSGYVVSVIGTALPTNTKLYLKSDSTADANTSFTDSSSVGRTLTTSGDMQHDTAQTKMTGSSSSILTDGTGDWVGFTNSADFGFGTGDFYMGLWYRPSTFANDAKIISQGGHGSVYDYNGFSWEIMTNKTMRFVNGNNTHPSGGGSWTTRCVSATMTMSTNTWYHLAVGRTGSTWSFWQDGVVKAPTFDIGSATTSIDIGSRDGKIPFASDGGGTRGLNGNWDDLIVIKGTGGETAGSSFTPRTDYLGQTVNATGTAIQAANAVGSAKTKVGGTMLYKDNAGTATIGTDLKIYFTCNGGTNWTEAASYNAITPVYSTGVKQVRLGETTCTSGTDVRYKAVWANQASGSKETQLHGIGVNY